ncbi:hypothetical protein NDU88_003937 [Pleurodeles waltl]|uniref:Uncharacterized protein n=1 Tax=Pleurodeles waltl TaxID=8319 RepID=A0AAV7SHD7_PLEWA|nr:hypothetical protein NDU88_003937 [Pleurodeles waltl]
MRRGRVKPREMKLQRTAEPRLQSGAVKYNVYETRLLFVFMKAGPLLCAGNTYYKSFNDDHVTYREDPLGKI